MRPAGRTDSRLLYRDDDPRLEIVAPCSRWSFDSDGNLFKLAAASKTDLVFLDPDSGIEIPSKPVGHKNSSGPSGHRVGSWQQDVLVRVRTASDRCMSKQP